MRLLADLHTHSTASDGQYSPAQVVELAHKSGIQVLAITDHDTIHGVEEAVQAGQSLELTVLRGVELGAQEDRHMHILGLGLKQDCPELAQLCQKLLDGRNERKYRIVRFLSEKGISIDLAEVEALAGGDVIARPHFAQIMVRHGYVKDSREALTAIWTQRSINVSSALRPAQRPVSPPSTREVEKPFWHIHTS